MSTLPGPSPASKPSEEGRLRLASRMAEVVPFHVMEMAKQAAVLEASPLCDPAQGGQPMLRLNIGEPDSTAAPEVVQAAVDCLRAGRTQYTDALGTPELRGAIAGWYRTHFGLDIAPERVAVTAGASSALQLLCLALFEPGDEVLMPDPCYPCNRQYVHAAGARAVLLRCGPEQRHQPSAQQVAEAWGPKTRGVLLASPSNPTGTSIDPGELRAVCEVVAARGGVTVVDEIYLGLNHDPRYRQSVLGLHPQAISVNSFSKYFGMTGWRLGWLVLPPALVEPFERLAQHLTICASAVAQHAALACFTPQALQRAEALRLDCAERRALVLQRLQAMGLPVPVLPDGAFYVWVHVGALGWEADDFCQRLMREAQVVLTPGRDFGPSVAAGWVRLSYAVSHAQLQEALDRMARWLATARPVQTAQAARP